MAPRAILPTAFTTLLDNGPGAGAGGGPSSGPGPALLNSPSIASRSLRVRVSEAGDALNQPYGGRISSSGAALVPTMSIKQRTDAVLGVSISAESPLGRAAAGLGGRPMSPRPPAGAPGAPSILATTSSPATVPMSLAERRNSVIGTDMSTIAGVGMAATVCMADLIRQVSWAPCSDSFVCTCSCLALTVTHSLSKTKLSLRLRSALITACLFCIWCALQVEVQCAERGRALCLVWNTHLTAHEGSFAAMQRQAEGLKQALQAAQAAAEKAARNGMDAQDYEMLNFLKRENAKWVILHIGVDLYFASLLAVRVH